MVDNKPTSYDNGEQEAELLPRINTQDILQVLSDVSLPDFDSQTIDFTNGHQHEMPIHFEQSYKMEPEHWNKFPNLENVDSEFQFDIHVDPSENLNWLYHHKMEKIYIKLNSVMNLSFSYMPANCGLFLRAMIIFSSPDEMHLPVGRCPNHRVQRDPKHTPNTNDIPLHHILKCCHPETRYVGSEFDQTFGKRSSLVLPLGQTKINEHGRCTESIGLEFLCQNSCSNGIQRKQTAVVFTLENSYYEILGKKMVHFKVCSCPKRDMNKEFNSIHPTKKRDAPSAPPGKHPSKMLCLAPVKIEPQLPQQQDVQMALPTPPIIPPTTPQSPMIHNAVADPWMQSISEPSSPAEKPVSFTLVMPNTEMALNVLRLAYSQVAAAQKRDGGNQKLDVYCNNIDKIIDVIEEQDALK